jgi:hypothetical protein
MGTLEQLRIDVDRNTARVGDLIRRVDGNESRISESEEQICNINTDIESLHSHVEAAAEPSQVDAIESGVWEACMQELFAANYGGDLLRSLVEKRVGEMRDVITTFRSKNDMHEAELQSLKAELANRPTLAHIRDAEENLTFGYAWGCDDHGDGPVHGVSCKNCVTLKACEDACNAATKAHSKRKPSGV